MANKKITFLSIVGAAVYAVIVTTGLLVVGLTIYAALNDQNLADLYTRTFPSFRGGPVVTPVPRGALILFGIYAFAASQIAIVARRWIARRLSR